MRKGIALILVTALLLTGTMIFAAAEGNNPLAEQVEDRLHASIRESIAYGR